MKKIIFFSLLLLGLANGTKGQGADFLNGYINDSLIASGAVDTVFVYIGGAKGGTSGVNFYDYGSLEVVLRTDSLSGSTNATAYMEYAYDAGPNVWYREATMLTLNGAAAQYAQHTDNNFTARNARVVVLCASSTQTNRVRVSWAWKKVQGR